MSPSNILPDCVLFLCIKMALTLVANLEFICELLGGNSGTNIMQVCTKMHGFLATVRMLDTGRTVLLAWVCMLAVAHPLANFRNNLHVMSNSLVCTEVKVINSTAKLVKLALAPINGQLHCNRRVYGLNSFINASSVSRS